MFSAGPLNCSRTIVLALILLLTGLALPQHQQQVETEFSIRQEQILHAVNLLRAERDLPAITMAPQRAESVVALEPTAAVGVGSISGKLDGLESPRFLTATVVAWSVDSSGVGFSNVDHDGAYRITRLPAGDYYVLAAVDGYIPKFYDNALSFSEATTVRLGDGADVAGIDFDMEVLPPGTGVISGTVTTKIDSTPLAGAIVTVTSIEHPFEFGHAETDDQGNYRVTELRSGEYRAVAFARGFLVEFFEETHSVHDATPIFVREPEEVSGINFTLSAGGEISGRVVNQEGAPITGAFVQALSELILSGPTDPDSAAFYPDGLIGRALTDRNGEYVISGLQPGTFFVNVRAADVIGRAFTWYDNVNNLADATPVPVIEEEVTPGIDFQLDLQVDRGSIEGRVVDSQGHPLGRAVVSAEPLDGRGDPGTVPFLAVFTDSDGKYVMENLREGRYLLHVSVHSAWQFVERWWPDAENRDDAEPVVVDAVAGPVVADFEVPFVPGTAVVSGEVRSTSGALLPFAFVEISPAETDAAVPNGAVWAYANTDSNGTYEIANLPAGIYTAKAQYWEEESFGVQWFDHQDGRGTATPIELTQGDRIENIDFDLDIRPFFGSLAGTVTDDLTGQTAARVYVELTFVNPDPLAEIAFFPWPFFAITDENGNYQIERVPEGEYLVAVYTNGGFEYFEDVFVPEMATAVKITGGETRAVNFSVLPRNDGTGVISGQVYDEYNDAPLEIAVVTAIPAVRPLVWPDSERFYNAVIDANGFYEIDGLPDGEYIVMAFAPEHVAEYYRDAFDPADATPVIIDSQGRATNIDFSLHPQIFFRTSVEGDPAFGQTGPRVQGRVTDQNQAGLANAVVYLLNEQEESISSARSDLGGRYSLSNFPPGTYRLRATRIGFESVFNGSASNFSAAEPLQLNAGQMEVDFTLQAGLVSGVAGDGVTPPATVVLYENHPNPFNPSTEISFSLPAETEIKLTIFNLLGQRVRILQTGVLAAGPHLVTWNGRNGKGVTVPSGVYFYVLQTSTPDFLVRRMTLLK